ncbi:MAG: spore maturation protein [Clostridia bacterium]|nr:spore maturation protein [Clostridia bacterium]
MNYLTSLVMPCMILVIILIGIKEKKDVYSLFISGAFEGLKMVYSIFPYIFGITIAVGLLRDTGVIDKIAEPFSNILYSFGVPSDIIPMLILRPLSGSASMAMAMEVFETSSPDSKAGNIVSIIMGSTETTLYSVAVLYSVVKVKKARGTIIAGLFADFIAITLSIVIVNKFF